MGRTSLVGPIMLALVLVSAAFSPASAQSSFTENTLRLDDPDTRPRATLEDVRWMAGSWRGTGFGGTVSEVWDVPAGGSMVGFFKLVTNGRASFYEMLWVVEEEESLAIKLKHFGANLHGWEAPDEVVDFPLVRLGDEAAWFDGITYMIRDDGCLVVWAALENRGEIAESELIFAPAGEKGHAEARCNGAGTAG